MPDQNASFRCCAGMRLTWIAVGWMLSWTCIASDWVFTDLGGPPTALGTFAEGRTVIVLGDDIVLATRDGLWRRPHSSEGGWQRSALAGFDTVFVIAEGGRLYAGGMPRDGVERPIYVSNDAGNTWINATETPFDRWHDRHEGMAEVVCTSSTSK